MARRRASGARRRRRLMNQRATEALATALVTPTGCLWRDESKYCGEEVVLECESCHIPLCVEHAVDTVGILCPSCYNGYLQQEGSWHYTPEEVLDAR